MSNIKTPKEIDRLLKDGRIDEKIAEEYKDEWLELSTSICTLRFSLSI